MKAAVLTRRGWRGLGIMRPGFALMLVICLIAGCAAIGPVSSPEFRHLVARAVPEEDGEVVLAGSGNWYPNIRGFTNVRSILLTDNIGGIPGVLVLTSNSVLFEQWNEKTQRFDVVKRLPLSEVREVSLDSYGVNRCLVVRKRDLSYDSFDFTQGSGAFIDASRAEEGYKFLQSRVRAPDN
jgi:hypothetical protein